MMDKNKDNIVSKDELINKKEIDEKKFTIKGE